MPTNKKQNAAEVAKGAELVEKALAFMKSSADTNRQYVELMEHVLKLSKQAGVAAHSIDMQQRIGKIRSRIKEM